MEIFVAGGTGVLGQASVEALVEAGGPRAGAVAEGLQFDCRCHFSPSATTLSEKCTYVKTSGICES